MPRRRSPYPAPPAALASDPALRALNLSVNQRWAVLGAPGVIVAGLLANGLSGLASALPPWWTVWSFVMFSVALALAVAVPFAPLRAGDLERFDESRVWMFSVVALYGSAFALVLTLQHAAALHIDAPRGTLSEPARTALFWVATATGCVCAAAVATAMASVAMLVRTWAEGQRLRLWRAEPGLVAARAARGAADRLGWLDHRGDALLRHEAVYLLQVTQRAARIGILRSAFRGSPGVPRQLLTMDAACVRAGLVAMEVEVYDRTRLRSTAARLRQMAKALEGGYWSGAARVLGDEARDAAVSQRGRGRQRAVDIIAALALAGLFRLTFLPPQLLWPSAPSPLTMRWALGGLTAVHLLAVARRERWVGGGGYGTLSGLLGGILGMVGVPIPSARRAEEGRPKTRDDTRSSE